MVTSKRPTLLALAVWMAASTATAAELQAPIVGGDTVSFQSLLRPAEDGPTLVVFATVWCRVCVSEIPQLQAWQKAHDARVLYVMSGTPEERTRAHCEKYGIGPSFDVIADQKGPIADAFQVQATPTLYLFEGPDRRHGPFTRIHQLPEPAERAKKAELIRYEDHSRELGTTYSVRILAPAEERSRVERDLREVRAMTRVLEARLSEWKDDSEISRVNARADQGPVELSKTLMHIIDGALKVSAATDGAFDVTWRPLGALWDEAETTGEVPDAQRLEKVLGHVGWQNLERKGATLRFTRPGTQLGIAGVAKGWIIDAVYAELLRRGHTRILVNIGGDLRTAGPDLDGRPRRMKLADPFRPDEVAALLTLADTAVATSGNYFRTRRIGDRHVGHILDPRTGMPPDFEGSVSVLTRDAAMADALATALFVMGPDAGLKFAAQTPNVDVVYATREGIRTTLPDRVTAGTLPLLEK